MVRDSEGLVQDIVEEQHADAKPGDIYTRLTPASTVSKPTGSGRISTSYTVHPNGEYYLTDLVGIAVREKDSGQYHQRFDATRLWASMIEYSWPRRNELCGSECYGTSCSPE